MAMRDPLPWRTDLPILVRLEARQMALSVRYLHVMLDGLKRRKMGNELPDCSLADWLLFYDDPARVWAATFSDVEEIEEEEERREVASLFDGIREGLEKPEVLAREALEALKSMTAEDFQEINKAGEEEYHQQSKEIRKEFRTGFVADSKALERLNDPAAHFFLKVLLPCAVYFGDLPGRMMQRARQGEVQVLCDLLTVDKAVLFDPAIQGIAWKRSVEEPGGFRKSIAKAMQESRRVPSLQRVKALGSALVIEGYNRLAKGQQMLGILKGKAPTLTSEDLRLLFSMVEFRYSERQRDPSLPPGKDAWRKAIDRELPQARRLLGQ